MYGPFGLNLFRELGLCDDENKSQLTQIQDLKTYKVLAALYHTKESNIKNYDFKEIYRL